MEINNSINENNKFFTTYGNKQAFSIKEVVVKYLSFLPLFILSLVLSLGTAYIYIRYSVPIYSASVQVLIKNPGKNINSDLITQAVSGVRSINLDNEIQQIKTVELIKKVVEKGNFNLLYSKEGNVKTFDAYKATPFEVIPLSISDSSKTYEFKVSDFRNQGLKISFAKGNKFLKWNDSFNIDGFAFKIIKYSNVVDTKTDPFTIKWSPSSIAAAKFKSKLSVGTLGKNTSVLILNLSGESRRKCEDFLNLLVKEIKENDIIKKQETSYATIEFIDGRLNLVSKELKDLEEQIKNYKKENRFFTIEGEYGYLQGRLTEAEKQVLELQMDIMIIERTEDYLRNNKSINKSKLIPSSLGVSDGPYNSLINSYNQLQVQREKFEYIGYKNNPAYEELINQIDNTKQSIYEAGASLKESKKLKIATFSGRSDVDMAKLEALPDKELMLIDINRQKGIKEKLFLYLLQKREETAIATVSTESNFLELDPAVSSATPIEPRESQIKTFALLLGLLIPVAFIYLLEVLNDKITTRNDLSSKTDIPIVGEISHVDNVNKIVVESSRNIVAEQFRILRSNLQFILSNHQNSGKATTLLVTSSISGEGKSFISVNLAAVLALTGKKVALLEFDLRKIKGIQIDEIEDNNDRGLTNFLIGQTTDLSKLYKTINKFPGLHLYTSGPIPPNPAELIINNQMEPLFTYLKSNYDFIVVDSAPVGLVSDSFALNKFADAVMFIVRQRYTLKKQLDFINDLNKDKKLNNMAIVVNDVNLTGRYGYYGYGYGYGYGYMYRYGVGYGYNKYVYGNKKQKNNYGLYFDDKIKLKWWQKIFK
jgi:capsular exopolysaccharide synthesis family protein